MTTPRTPPADFTEITQRIASARARAMQAVNTALIAQYQTQLPDIALLQAKLHELYLQNAPEVATPTGEA
jgi:hypothetical protein